MPQSRGFAYWNALAEHELPEFGSADHGYFFRATWKALRQARALDAAGDAAGARKVLNDRVWAIEQRELPKLAGQPGEEAARVRAYLTEAAALFRAGRLPGSRADGALALPGAAPLLPGGTPSAGELLSSMRRPALQFGDTRSHDSLDLPLTHREGVPYNEPDNKTPVRKEWVIGPQERPWLVFTGEDVREGAKVGAAAVGSALTMGVWDGGQYKADPAFATSRLFAEVGRDAGLLALGLAAKGFTVVARSYPNVGGGGLSLLKNGKRVFGTDYHHVKSLGNRLHVHIGRNTSQMGRHRPFQGGMRALRDEGVAFLQREAPALVQALGPVVTAEVVEWFITALDQGEHR